MPKVELIKDATIAGDAFVTGEVVEVSAETKTWMLKHSIAKELSKSQEKRIAKQTESSKSST